MIRHSSSFFISLAIHLTLLLLLVYTWENYSIAPKEVKEKKVCIELCDIVSEQQIQKHILRPKVRPKPKKVETEKKKIKISKPKPIKKEIVKSLVQEFKEPEIVEKINVKTPHEIKQNVEVEKIVEVEPVEKPVVLKDEVVEVKIVKKSSKLLEEEHKIKQKNLEKEYVEINIQKISQLLRENLYYPRSARKRAITGDVMVKFTLGVDAKVYNLEVTKSNSDILSRAAIKTINNLSGEFPKPKQEITLHVPIGYSLK